MALENGKTSLEKSNNKWSGRLRHVDIQIFGLKIRRISKTKWRSVCCLTKSLKDINGDLSRWSIRINTINDYMQLGICQIKQA
jgi:hypothetical protein